MLAEKLLKLEGGLKQLEKDFKEVDRRERLTKTQRILEALSNLYKGQQDSTINALLEAIEMDKEWLEDRIKIKLDDTILHETQTITITTLIGILREHEPELLDYVYDTVKWLHDRGVNELNRIEREKDWIKQKLRTLTEDLKTEG